MRLSPKASVGWAIALLWAAYVVACVRGLEWGFQWHLMPEMMFAAIVFGFPGYLVLFLLTPGSKERRFAHCGLAVVLAFPIALGFVAFEEHAFLKAVQEAGQGKYKADRWWYPGDVRLYYEYGGPFVVE